MYDVSRALSSMRFWAQDRCPFCWSKRRLTEDLYGFIVEIGINKVLQRRWPNKQNKGPQPLRLLFIFQNHKTMLSWNFMGVTFTFKCPSSVAISELAPGPPGHSRGISHQAGSCEKKRDDTCQRWNMKNYRLYIYNINNNMINMILLLLWSLLLLYIRNSHDE